MNAFLTLVNSWLLGGLTYPALTFVITAAMKSTAIVLLAWSVSTFLRRKPALMRLWLWRGCSVALLGVLLWALAPSFVDSWRVRLTASFADAADSSSGITAQAAWGMRGFTSR